MKCIMGKIHEQSILCSSYLSLLNTSFFVKTVLKNVLWKKLEFVVENYVILDPVDEWTLTNRTRSCLEQNGNQISLKIGLEAQKNGNQISLKSGLKAQEIFKCNQTSDLTMSSKAYIRYGYRLEERALDLGMTIDRI